MARGQTGYHGGSVALPVIMAVGQGLAPVLTLHLLKEENLA